jgi:hypothetical protein
MLAVVTMAVLATGLVLPTREDAGYFRQIRAIETAEIGMPTLAGLAFVPSANALTVLDAGKKGPRWRWFMHQRPKRPVRD